MSFVFRAFHHRSLVASLVLSALVAASLLGMGGCSPQTSQRGAQTATSAAASAASRDPNAAAYSRQVYAGAQRLPVYAPRAAAPERYAPPMPYAVPQYPSPKAENVPPKVAVLLPLSGKNAALGQAMLNAAQMAVFDLADGEFELMPRDTGNSPASAASAARDALSGGARLIIGPVFAADVAAVKPLAAASGVSVLALSTDVSLAGDGAYVMGFAPFPQVERVVAFARSRGLSRLAAVMPDGSYGEIVRKALDYSARRHGATVVAETSLAEAGKLGAAAHRIDALLLPFGGGEAQEAVRKFAAAAREAGAASSPRLLGTGLWDEPNIGGTAPALVGGWYAAAEPDSRDKFISSYQKSYGQKPPRLATLAYDATALAIALARRGGGFGRGGLENPDGFAGIDGIFRLNPDGTVERGLAVNEITPSLPQVVDPSPASFARGGYRR